MIETIDEAKKFLRENWEKGVACPCCNQLVKLYSVALNGSMARSLIELYKLDQLQPDSFHHISEFDAWTKGYSGGKFAKVKYWGLAIDEDNSDPDKKTSGMWRITEKGRKFTEKSITVPSHAKLYNRGFYGYEGEQVDILNVIDKKFSYQELMGERQVSLL